MYVSHDVSHPGLLTDRQEGNGRDGYTDQECAQRCSAIDGELLVVSPAWSMTAAYSLPALDHIFG